MQKRIPTILLLLVLGLSAARQAGADPGNRYPIAPEAGRWLICAASYTGPQAGALAHELCEVVRRDYKLPAFVFDRGGDERRKQQEQVTKVRELAPEGRIRTVRIEEQFAVLVGGYKDMPAARRALDDFKKLPIPPAKFCDTGTVQTKGTKDGQEGTWIKEVRYSPFWTSFVVHNPTVPKEDTEAKGNDYQFLKQLNAGESYSLLRCPKPWTLAVQTFYGGCVIQQPSKSSKFLDLLPFGDKGGEKLNAAALQAHELAGVLKKVEHGDVKFPNVYVLHTRSSSVVTVGAYDGPNDPKLQYDMHVLSKMKLTSRTAMEIQPKALPMEVPKP